MYIVCTQHVCALSCTFAVCLSLMTSIHYTVVKCTSNGHYTLLLHWNVFTHNVFWDPWRVYCCQVVVHILGQQQGLPVTYLCRLICDSAWHKYVVAQKKERGIVEKVKTTSLLIPTTYIHVVYYMYECERFSTTESHGSVVSGLPVTDPKFDSLRKSFFPALALVNE